MTELDWKRRGLAEEAIDVLDHLGRGSLLRVPHDGSQITLTPRYYASDDVPPDHKPFGPPIPVALSSFHHLRSRQLICRLTRDGEPPKAKRVPLDSYRCGWLELGLNGEDADWYVLYM